MGMYLIDEKQSYKWSYYVFIWLPIAVFLKNLIYLSCTLVTISVIQSLFSVSFSLVCSVEDIEHNLAMIDKQENKAFLIMLSGSDNKEHKIF